MRLFVKDKEKAVQGFVLKLLNTNCHELLAKMEGPRLEGRVNLTLVVWIVPVEDEELLVRRAFTAVTKEFSSKGVAVVLNEPRGIDSALIGFRWRGGVTWLRARAKHLNPMGGGFYQLGFQLTDVVSPSEYPELRSASF